MAAGKRLIVEFVTVKITLPNGQAALFAKRDTSVFDQYITLTAAGNDSVGNTLVVATHKVFVIFDPGTAEASRAKNQNPSKCVGLDRSPGLFAGPCQISQTP